MIEVSVLTGRQEPVGEGVVLELLSQDGTVLGSGATDAAGVVTFDVDSAGLGPVAVRCGAEASEAAAAAEPSEANDER